MDYSGKLNGLYTESHTGGCFTLYRSGENKLKEMGMGKQGEMGRQGSKGGFSHIRAGKNDNSEIRPYLPQNVPCSLKNDRN